MKMAPLLAFVVLFITISGAEVLKTETEIPFDVKLFNLIKDVHRVDQFKGMLFLRTSHEHFFDDFVDKFIQNVSSSLVIPVIISTKTTTFRLTDRYNENFLVIVQSSLRKKIIYRLTNYLYYIRFCKTIILPNSQPDTDADLKSMFESLTDISIINVIVIYPNFVNTSVVYSYKSLADFSSETFNQSIGFPERLKNLDGLTLPILFGGPDPAVIVEYDANGDVLLGGYLGHLFRAFAKRHNAKLNTANALTKNLPKEVIVRMASQNATIAATGPSILGGSAQVFSYPYLFSSWGVIVPIEPRVPIYKVFTFVIQWKVLLLTLALLVFLSAILQTAAKYLELWEISLARDILYGVMDCFFALLGQSFSEAPNATQGIKIIYLLIFLLGIMIVTSYNAFLQSFLTDRPREKMIRTLEELIEAGYRVYIPETECLVLFMMIQTNRDAFHSESNFTTFIQTREAFNTTYAYSINAAKWNAFKTQQDFYGREVFRWAEELCLLQGSSYSVFMKENNIYKKKLDLFIMEILAAGLFDHWSRRTFYELLELGKKPQWNFVFEVPSQLLNIADLRWVWIFLCMSLLLSTLCLIAEICIFRWKKWQQRSVVGGAADG